ncbi:hypothetical protein NQ318_007636 [Aromia moschata]|uniref:Uncharacterized protein n=1 Tax=Aromia moschata TaxID=1265417 RepID=A0AAV8YDZ2_9CUCU|nr:hypothetical protein NQ318_007636 [Aromia moschata]
MQAEVVRLFQEKYPELPPISQGTERLTASGHGSLTLSSGSPGYSAGASGGHHRGSGALHHTAAAMQHQLPQPDFQPPYFPPPFHHPPSPPPQQHLDYLTDPYGGLSSLHHYNQLGLRPRDGDNNHTHVRHEILDDYALHRSGRVERTQSRDTCDVLAWGSTREYLPRNVSNSGHL